MWAIARLELKIARNYLEKMDVRLLRRLVKWGAVALLAVAVLGRAGAVDSRLDLLNVALPLTIFLAAACIFLAVFKRDRRSMLVAAAALLIAYSGWPAGNANDLPAPGTGQIRQSITVISANLFRGNRSPAAAVDRLLAERADILLLQEFNNFGAEAQRLAQAYPHHSHCPARCDLAIFSRLPADRPRYRFRDAAGQPVGPNLLWAVIRPAAGPPFMVVSAHLSRPYLDPPQHRRELDMLADAVGRRAGPGTILAGDFNVPGWTAGFMRLEKGLFPMRRTDGGHPTYPAGRSLAGWKLPAVLPIDHLMAGQAWSLAASKGLTIPGSDHRAIRLVLTRLVQPGEALEPEPGAAIGAPTGGQGR